jgi:septum site-determining protein MinD
VTELRSNRSKESGGARAALTFFSAPLPQRAVGQRPQGGPSKEDLELAKIVVVTSGKGGVGKTTTSAAFSAGLALRGYKTVVIDFDVGLRNLDLIMGCERRVVYDLLNVIHGEGSLNQALIKDKRVENLYILPASQTRDKDALTIEGVERVINQLKERFDYIVCDSPAGIEHGAIAAMYFADEALIVTNPEVSSVRDSDRIIGMLASKTRRAEEGTPVKEHLVVTRYDPNRVDRGDMMSAADVQEILAIPFLGVIPESPSVLLASNSGVPVTLAQSSDAGEAYLDVVDRFLGKERPHRFMDVTRKGFLSRLFGT